MELSERCPAEDENEGYAPLLHVLAGHDDLL